MKEFGQGFRLCSADIAFAVVERQQFSHANFRVRIIDLASSTARDCPLDAVALRVGYHP